MKNLLTAKFWFNMRPGTLLPFYDKVFLVLLTIFFLASVVFFFLRRRKWPFASWCENTYSFSLTNFLFGSLYYFLVYEYIPFLSSRFWFLLWFGGVATWAYYLAKDYQELKLKRQRIEADKNARRYIP